MTDRVERFLEAHLAGSGVEAYSAGVDALVVAGLLSSEGAGRWKAEHARMRARSHGHDGPYDEEIEARAIRLLEDLFAPVRPRAGDDWDPAMFQRYQQALLALTGIGALSSERARPWLLRHQEAFTPAGGRPEREPDPEIAFAAAALSAVVAGPQDRLDGMRITCLELYGDCVIVRFHQLLPREQPADPVQRREYLRSPFALQDDAGTYYRPAAVPEPRDCTPCADEAWGEGIVGWQAFVPGAPLTAHAFTVSWREQRFRLG